MSKIKVGDRFVSNQGSECFVVKYESSKKVIIQYTDKHSYRQKTTAKDLREGKIRNPYIPSVFGVGFIGSGKYGSGSSKDKNKSYSVWTSMLERCYGNDPRHAAYKDCTVCDEWHNFQVFSEWYYGQSNYGEKMEIDKDIILYGNKIYSPNTCCLVPREINILTQRKSRQRGDLLIGVKKQGGRYHARIRIESNSVHLGCFGTELEAFECYKKAKEDHIKNMAIKYKSKLTPKIIKALNAYKVGIED